MLSSYRMRRGNGLAGGGGMLRRAALKTAGRPVSKFLESDTESESDAGTPKQAVRGDGGSGIPRPPITARGSSPIVSDSSDADSPATVARPANASRFGWRNNLYDDYDPTPEASPVALRNGVAGRDGRRNPLYHSESSGKGSAGSAVVAAWSELEQSMTPSKPQVLESPSISSTVSYSPGESPQDNSNSDAKKGRAGAAMSSLEEQIAELNMAIKEFKGISQMQAPRLASLEEAIPRLQVAVEDISSWVEEIDGVVGESCGLQASMKESQSKCAEAIQSFNSRMSAMERSLAQMNGIGMCHSQTADAASLSNIRPVDDEVMPPQSKGHVPTDVAIKKKAHTSAINVASGLLPWAVVAVLLAWMASMGMMGLDLKNISGTSEWAESMVASVTGAASYAHQEIGNGVRVVWGVLLDGVFLMWNFVAMASEHAHHALVAMLPLARSFIESTFNTASDVAVMAVDGVRVTMIDWHLQIQHLQSMMVMWCQDTSAALVPMFQGAWAKSVEVVGGIIGTH